MALDSWDILLELALDQHWATPDTWVAYHVSPNSSATLPGHGSPYMNSNAQGLGFVRRGKRVRDGDGDAVWFQGDARDDSDRRMSG